MTSNSYKAGDILVVVEDYFYEGRWSTDGILISKGTAAIYHSKDCDGRDWVTIDGYCIFPVEDKGVIRLAREVPTLTPEIKRVFSLIETDPAFDVDKYHSRMEQAINNTRSTT